MKVQKRAAKFVTGNYIYETGSMTRLSRTTKVGISEKRRRDSRIIMLYKGLKGAASIPTNDVKRPRGRAVSAPDFGSRGHGFESRWRRDSSRT